MDCSYILKTHAFFPEKLLLFGFCQEGNGYTLKRDLQENGLYALVNISESSFTVRVIDSDFNDDYLPFGVKDAPSIVRSEVEELISQIVASCFESSLCRERIALAVEREFGIIREFPFSDYPEIFAFYTKQKHKWFALFMDVKAQKLGVEGQTVDILNIKATPEDIARLVDGVRYFPAYHMNKKYWLTVLLDKNADGQEILNLIKNSYALAEKSKN